MSRARTSCIVVALFASIALAQDECVHQTIPACSGPDVTLGKRASDTLPMGHYGTLRIRNGGTLVLDGGDYSFCEMRVSRRGALLFAAGARIEVAGNVAFSNGSRVGPVAGGPAPCDVRMQVGGESVVIARLAQVSLVPISIP